MTHWIIVSTKLLHDTDVQLLMPEHMITAYNCTNTTLFYFTELDEVASFYKMQGYDVWQI